VLRSGTPSSARIGEGGSPDVAIGAIPKRAQMAVWDAVLGY
jgi:hypothetical protein